MMSRAHIFVSTDPKVRTDDEADGILKIHSISIDRDPVARRMKVRYEKEGDDRYKLTLLA